MLGGGRRICWHDDVGCSVRVWCPDSPKPRCALQYRYIDIHKSNCVILGMHATLYLPYEHECEVHLLRLDAVTHVAALVGGSRFFSGATDDDNECLTPFCGVWRVRGLLFSDLDRPLGMKMTTRWARHGPVCESAPPRC